MDDSRSIEELIREEAYAIYRVREKRGIPGTKEGDWINAEDKIRHSVVLGAEDIISPKVRKKITGGY